MNGDLRVAYRASPEGERDIVFVAMWSSNCEDVPELPSLRGWVEAMTSLGRLIFFDQPGTGVSDPITAGALPTLELWADSITAVLDDLGSREAVLLASTGSVATGALFAATHPSRTAALVVLEGYANPMAERTVGPTPEEITAATVAAWGTGEMQHAMNPDMPWNEEIRAAWARSERLGASPGTFARMMPLLAEMDVRAVLPTVRVPTLVLHHTDDPAIPPQSGKDVADRISGAKYVEVPGRNMFHFVEPWRESFQEIAQFLTGQELASTERMRRWCADRLMAWKGTVRDLSDLLELLKGQSAGASTKDVAEVYAKLELPFTIHLDSQLVSTATTCPAERSG